MKRSFASCPDLCFECGWSVLCFIISEMEALDEEMESELDLMQFLVDAMGYLLKMHRCADA